MSDTKKDITTISDETGEAPVNSSKNEKSKVVITVKPTYIGTAVIVIAVFFGLIYFIRNGFISLQKKNDSIVETSVSAESSFSDKNLSLNFIQTTGKEKSVEIVSFEEKEGWQGNLFFNTDQYIEGEGSIALKADVGTPASISASVSASLGTFDAIKMGMYLSKDEDVSNVESVIIRLIDKNNVSFQAPIRTLKKGWSVVRLPKNSFVSSSEKSEALSSIKRVEIEVKARGKMEVVFDRLWAEGKEDWKTEFQTTNAQSLSLKEFNGRSLPQLWQVGTHFALLKKVTLVENFTFTAKLIPQKKNAFGIVFRADSRNGFGYYLVLDGIDTNGWKLYRYGTPVNKNNWIILKQGILEGFTVEKNKPYWLRVETKGSKIIAYVSLNGKTFYKLTETSHGEFKRGGVGVGTMNSSFLVESVDFTQ